MLTKTIIPLSITLIFALLFSSVALAGELTAQQFARVVYGEVTEIEAGTLTLENVQGEFIVFQLDEETRYRAADLENPGAEDLQIGAKVAVFVAAVDEDQMTARLVILLPDDFDPSQWASIRVRGEITGVDIDSFTVQTHAGEQSTFVVDDVTRFFGQVSNVSDLQTGSEVAVGGVETEDGNLLARLVTAVDLENTVTHLGTVAEVNPVESTFTFITRADQEFLVTVDDVTKFNSRNDEIQSLDALRPDMVAIVVGISRGDGQILATRIAAANAEDLPNFDLRAGGQVVSVGEDSLTIQSPDGEEATFLIDEETRFRGRGGISGLDDIEEGMTVLVGGFDEGNQLPLAKLVLVGKK